MAYDYIVCAIFTYGTVVYRRAQCLRSEYLLSFTPLAHNHNSPRTNQFANVHDVSWGTKGDNKVQTDLGKVQVSAENKNQVEVVVPTTKQDINALYEDAIHVLQTKPPKVEAKLDAATVQEDYYRGFRTKCAFLFCFCF